MSQSAHIISWSDIPGLVVIAFVSPGLFVQKRSKMRFSRVEHCCCGSRPNRDNISRTLDHMVDCLAPLGTEFVSQFMSPALKSPPTIVVAFGSIAYTCSMASFVT